MIFQKTYLLPLSSKGKSTFTFGLLLGMRFSIPLKLIKCIVVI